MKKAIDIKKKLEKSNREAYLFAIKEVVPMALIQFPNVNAFINTACPRIALDDASIFLKPVLTLNEALVMLDESAWEELCQKGWFHNIV